jgi:hypothetical protein
MSSFPGMVRTDDAMTTAKSRKFACVAPIGKDVNGEFRYLRPLQRGKAAQLKAKDSPRLRTIKRTEHHQRIDISEFWVMEGLWQTADDLKPEGFPQRHGTCIGADDEVKPR